MPQQQLEQQTSPESQASNAGRDSQLSTVAQLAGGEAAKGGWSASGPQEPQQGQLNMQSMFSPANLASELGLAMPASESGAGGNNLQMNQLVGSLDQTVGSSATNGSAGNELANLGSAYSQLGAEFSAIGADFTKLGTDLNTMNTDISALMQSLQNAANGIDSLGTTPGSSAGGSAGNGGTDDSQGSGSDHHQCGGGHGGANDKGSGSGCGNVEHHSSGSSTGTGSGCGTAENSGSNGTGSKENTGSGCGSITQNQGSSGTQEINGSGCGNITQNQGSSGTQEINGSGCGSITQNQGSSGTQENTGSGCGSITQNQGASGTQETTGSGCGTTGDTTPRTPGTPFASNSVFNQPIGSDAQWTPNQQLQSAGVYINTNGNYNEPIYTGTASDPLVTVTSDGAAGGGAGTFEVNIPAGAQPAAGGDMTLTVDDTANGTWDSFGGFQWTGPNTATASQASSEPIDGSGITQSNGDWDEGVGTLTAADLQAGTIDHMLRMELPTDMLESVDPNSTSVLAPNAWPNTEEDGFANNGCGGPAYSGTVPYGVTIGIPAGTPEPADVAANPGANMLWQALEDHGAMVRDSGGSGNTVIFQTDQNVNQDNPLIQGMEQYGQQIMAATEILSNQGPDSINGGGTPIVPPDAPIS